SGLVRRLRYAVPQWRPGLNAALARAKERLAHTRIDGIDWYWPITESPANYAPADAVRFLTPFDPVVWDRRRFEMLWNWAYRFEAYTPAAKRKLGYYALPLLWRDRVIGWGNITSKGDTLLTDIGYLKSSAPQDRLFKRELDAELDRMRTFLGLALIS
ncbi:MAG TPA: crosslink repair DNA glycosylase YcaQ family protein, partial [Burkholderiaceae bacterium]|nr:crosslink repair DNA glycosylase YcaQ family protein [Burkholderiaceae bacterium]